MRKQDFIQSKLEETKFRVYSPEELVTTQEEVDDYATEFAEWVLSRLLGEDTTLQDGVIEKFKKEKGW